MIRKKLFIKTHEQTVAARQIASCFWQKVCRKACEDYSVQVSAAHHGRVTVLGNFFGARP